MAEQTFFSHVQQYKPLPFVVPSEHQPSGSLWTRPRNPLFSDSLACPEILLDVMCMKKKDAIYAKFLHTKLLVYVVV